jgi:stage V sporulation protein B
LGVAAKALSAWFLVGNPHIGHYGIPISTLVCYLIMFVCNLYFITKHVSYRINFKKTLVRPLLCAVSCGGSALFAYLALARILSPNGATVMSIIIGGGIYVLLLFKSKTFGKEEVLMLPKGEKIAKILSTLHLIKA